jgi:predicted GIY-YIG superfamily endonuclease
MHHRRCGRSLLPPPGTPCCYRIRSDAGLHYKGATCDLVRRMKQHNRLRSGGARYTRRGRGWTQAVVVTGFASWSQALSCEHAWKHNARRFRAMVEGLGLAVTHHAPTKVLCDAAVARVGPVFAERGVR